VAVLNKFYVRTAVLIGEIREGESGQGLMEYAILVAIVIAAAAGIAIILGSKLTDAYNAITP
jgi:hypothetical protein